MTPNRATLQTLIERCGLQLTSKQYDQLWAYHRLLRAANAELNLTRIHNFENMVLKHYVDSLLVLNFLELPSPLIDMGSGPGLPGIPLKIARPEIQIILAEPRAARAEFMQQVCNQLGLEGAEVHAGKIGRKYTRPVQGVITRAVASISETLDRVLGCLQPGGQMIFMKGPACEDELDEARSTRAEWFRLTADHAYEIPGTPHRRRLVVFERLDTPAPVAGSGSKPVVTYSGLVREISSASNPAFRTSRDLLTGRGIRKHGLALLAGSRTVAEVLQRNPDQADAWITTIDGPPPPPEAPERLPWLRLATPLFQELDISGTHSPLLQVRVPELPEWTDETPWPTGCTLFVPFQDPENVGAVIRSAAAFQVARVVLLREAAHPFHPKAARAAGSAVFQVPLVRGPSIADLKVDAAPLIPLDAQGDDLNAQPWPESFGLIPGVEGPGLPPSLRALPCRRVPIAERVESLNAATATAIALYAWKSRLPSPAN